MVQRRRPFDSPTLVGRDRELDLLRASLDAVLAGQGHLTLISGEAGIGKTALVRSLVQEAGHHGAIVLTGGCYDLTTTPPYGPWSEVIREYHPTHGQPPVPVWFSNPDEPGTVGSQAALFEEARRFFATIAGQQPLLIVLEDLHWSDQASLDLLRFVARDCHDAGVLLVVTFRDDELTRHHAFFQLLSVIARETDAIRIDLQRLTDETVHTLVEHLQLAAPDTTRLVAYLMNRTSGNPLFVTELLRSLAIEGVLVGDGAETRLGALDEGYLPAFVLQVIERRLARLAPDMRHTLEIAAIIGQDVPLQVWEAVSELDEDALSTVIEQAFETHVLEETPEPGTLRFTHALIREVLHEGVVPTRRRRWHRLVADALIATAQPDPDAVAFHLEQAGDPRLVDWLIRAGDRAERRHARLMAADRFDRAQALLYGDPERAGERAWLLFRTGLLLRHGDQVRSLQHLEAAEAVAWEVDQPVIAHLARAHQGLVRIFDEDVRRGLGDMQAGIFALEDLSAADQSQLDRLTASLATGLGVQGRATLALQMAEVGTFRDAQTLLEDWRQGAWERCPDAYRAAALIHAMLGQPTLARNAFTRSQRMYEALNDPGQAADDASLHLHRVQIPYAADNIDDRHQLIRIAQALRARDSGVPMPERQAETLWAFEFFLSGNWDQADTLLTWWQHHHTPTSFDYLDPWRLELARLRGDSATVWDAIRQLPDGPATEPGERRYFQLAALQVLAAELELDSGRTDQARTWLEAHDRLLAWSGAVLGRAESRLLWARYHLLARDLAAAGRHADRAFEHASDPRQPLALIAAHRTLGDLNIRVERHAEAERQFQQSLDLSYACGTPFERALTLLSLARLRAAQGRIEAAIELLDDVRTICEPLKATPTLEQATAVETQLHKPSTVSAAPFGLTPRELDVLRLVSEGLTDPEVAKRLFVSPRTISSHLTSIYTKLGVSSRTAATRIAIEQGVL